MKSETDTLVEMGRAKLDEIAAEMWETFGAAAKMPVDAEVERYARQLLLDSVLENWKIVLLPETRQCYTRAGKFSRDFARKADKPTIDLECFQRAILKTVGFEDGGPATASGSCLLVDWNDVKRDLAS